MTVIRFIIGKPNRSLYLKVDGSSVDFTAYIEQAKTFKTYDEAQAEVDKLPANYYQIDKIFRVK